MPLRATSGKSGLKATFNQNIVKLTAGVVLFPGLQKFPENIGIWAFWRLNGPANCQRGGYLPPEGNKRGTNIDGGTNREQNVLASSTSVLTRILFLSLGFYSFRENKA